MRLNSGQPVSPDLFAPNSLAAPQRAIAEFLAERPVVLQDDGKTSHLVLPVEALTSARLADLAGLADRFLLLFISGTRAAALGAPSHDSSVIPLPASISLERVMDIASGSAASAHGPIAPGDRLAQAAIEICKLAQLLPAALAVPLTAGPMLERSGSLVSLRVSDVLAFRAAHTDSLRLISRARVPLPETGDAHFVIFRDGLGHSWTAIEIGRPDLARPVPVRLHSACLTGDAFGSLRCDCGDQLRMAITTIKDAGGGVLLYLNQEGCGIGLANKMRAYNLQDQGLDTFDANTALGFERDERRYDIAARMLQLLGITSVALLTNNPQKLQGLELSGIRVAARIPLVAPMHSSNRRYLQTKQSRAGHMIGTLPGKMPDDGKP